MHLRQNGDPLKAFLYGISLMALIAWAMHAQVSEALGESADWRTCLLFGAIVGFLATFAWAFWKFRFVLLVLALASLAYGYGSADIEVWAPALALIAVVAISAICTAVGSSSAQVA